MAHRGFALRPGTPARDRIQYHVAVNRRCVNPEHLEPVSPQVNVLRGESPGAKAQRRTHCIHGHEYAIHGFMYRGRRKCRQCNIDYLRTYSAERRRARESQWIARGMAERGDVA